MPLLRGKFRPATGQARSRTNSITEADKVPQSHERTQTPLSDLRRGTFLSPPPPPPPASPIVVGIPSSPKRLSPFINSSPRKIPTTPFSPGRPTSPFTLGRPISPHFIMPPVPFTDSASESEEKRKDNDILVRDVSGQARGLTTYDSSDSDTDTRSNESSRDRMSSVDSGLSEGKKAFEKIDRSKMTMSELISVRLPKGDNPLTSIWKGIHDKEAEEKKAKDAEEEVKQTKKDQIKKLIEEAKEKGETLLEEDFEEEKDLPPLQVEIGDDGKIVINQKSLEVTREGNVIKETVEEDNAEITFGRYEDHKVNHNSFSRRKRAERKRWKNNDSEMFYAALRRVGTDFDLMAKILPSYTRDQLKRKFKREEKSRLWKVDLALQNSIKMDLEEVQRLPSPEPVKKKKKEETKTESRKRKKEYKRLPTPGNKRVFDVRNSTDAGDNASVELKSRKSKKEMKTKRGVDDLSVTPLNNEIVRSLKERLEDQGMPFPTLAPRGTSAAATPLANPTVTTLADPTVTTLVAPVTATNKIEAARLAHQEKRAMKQSKNHGLICSRLDEPERTITKGLVKTNINRKRELSEKSERRAREEKKDKEYTCSTPIHQWDDMAHSELDEVDKILNSPDTRFSVDDDVVTLEDTKQSSLPDLRYSPVRTENDTPNSVTS